MWSRACRLREYASAIMQKAARLIGLLWIAAAVIGGLIFLAESTAAIRPNLLHNSRGAIILIFFAALPGVLIYRWRKAGGA